MTADVSQSIFMGLTVGSLFYQLGTLLLLLFVISQV